MNVLLAVILILAAISALGVVFSSKTIYSALSLVLTVALLAAVFLVLNAQFLFVVQLIVYEMCIRDSPWDHALFHRGKTE